MIYSFYILTCENKYYYKMSTYELSPEASDLISTIVVKTGTVIAIGLTLSPGYLFYEICKKTRVYTEIPESMIISNVINNVIQLTWGYTKRDPNMELSSGACTSIAFLWGIIYLFYVNRHDLMRYLLHLFIMFNIGFELFWIFGNIIPDTNQLNQKVCGITAFILTIINNATPGQNIITVIKTGKYKLIPIVTVIFGTVCSACWCAYGFFIKDWMMYTPNGIGLLLNIVQIVVYTINYRKYKDKVWDDENTPTANPEEGFIAQINNEEEVKKEEEQIDEP